MAALLRVFRLKEPDSDTYTRPSALVSLSHSQITGTYLIEREQRDAPEHGGATWTHTVRRASKKAAQDEYDKACREARAAFPHYEVH